MMINTVYCVVFLCITTAIILISGLDKEIRAEVQRSKKAGLMKMRKRTIFSKLASLEKKRRLLISQVKMPPLVYWLMTGLGAVAGAVIGYLFFSSSIFVITVGILGALSPQLYISFKQTQVKNADIEKLLSSMMILSNSYIVTEDFLKSVQDNIDVLEYPVPFRDFLTYVSMINSNIKTGLRRLENQVDNAFFTQWIDILVMAQDDRSLKYVTMSVVDAMNDLHQAQRESDTAMFSIWREYFTVLILIFTAPMIFRILMKNAFAVLVTSLPGQVLLILLLVAVVYSIVKAVKLNRPLLI
jgi:hypothetical protein